VQEAQSSILELLIQQLQLLKHSASLQQMLRVMLLLLLL